MMTHSTIAEIAKRRPHDTWLQTKLADLELEMADLWADRNRLIAELSRARTTINHLRAGLEVAPEQRSRKERVCPHRESPLPP